MARKKGSKNRNKRQARRSPYQTYSDWYDTYTKDPVKAKLFTDKLTPKEFEDKYKRAKELGLKNPARTVAMAQERITREGERKAKKMFGKLPDLSDPKLREEFFRQFYERQQLEDGSLTHDEIEDIFKEYYY